MKAKTGKGGGKMAPPMAAKGEAKTARPAKQAVMSKPNEQSKRMMEAKGKRGGRF